MKKNILDRYSRTPDNRLVIDIAAGKVEDLYNNFDRHTPYVKKELNRGLAEYIIDSVGEIGKEDFVIQFSLTELPASDLIARVETSIHDYFSYLKELELRELARMTRSSLVLLLVGALFLFMSIWISQKTAGLESITIHVFVQGLTVAAWVSLWNAIAAFLIHWAPHRLRIKMYERIARAPLLFSEAAQGHQLI